MTASPPHDARRSRPRPGRALVALLGAVVVSLAGSAVAAGGTASGLSLETPSSPAVHGSKVTLTGAITPPAEGVEILVVRPEANGDPLASALTDAEGRYAATISPQAGDEVRALAMALGLQSELVEVQVVPKVTVKVNKGPAFADTKVTVRAKPASAAGRATVTVKRNGNVSETKTVRIAKGKGTTSVVAPGPGAFKVTVEFDPRGPLGASEAETVRKASVRYLSLGATGKDVAGLVRKLRELKIHVPPGTQSYTTQVADAVLAFQKLAGLERTRVMTAPAWRKLASMEPVTPSRKGPKNRIEVDKTRQILIKVRNGEVVGTLHVSTGRTGNTPEGHHNIRWKAPTTTTWLGPGILYRTLTFVGNSFAIHGWDDVPAYAASSGCVRVPKWTADWLYDSSPVGEAVIVHR